MKYRWLMLGMAIIGLSGCNTLGHSSERKLALFRSTVLVEHQGGHVTGFLVAKDRVLTVSENVPEDELSISFFHGETDEGQVVWRHEKHNLALVKLEVPSRYEVPRLSCQSPSPKLYYETIGHPIKARWVLTGGYFHDLESVGDGYRILSFPLALGMAGAPVFNVWGSPIGIVQALLAEKKEGGGRSNNPKDWGYGLMRQASDFCEDLKRALEDSA
ncbi:MAG: S1 family peptidase [Geminicoccaceae bacterium]